MELTDLTSAGTAAERDQREGWFRADDLGSGLFVDLVRNLTSPVVLLNWELEVVCQSRAAEFPGVLSAEVEGGGRVTEHVREFCQLAKARWLQLSSGRERLGSAEDDVNRKAFEPQSGASVVLLQPETRDAARPFFLIQCAATRAEPREDVHGGLLARLTACERQVARLVCEGCTNEEVAAKLGKSALTVKKQLRSIYQKLQVKSRARLCALVHHSRSPLLGSADTPKE